MKIYEICFSPTGGTKKVADTLAGRIAEEIRCVDLTDPRGDYGGVSLTPADTAIVAVPSYGGRVPAAAVNRLAAIQGNGAEAILVCVYGNRAYEDTLVELEDTVKQAGFRVVAAVAAIAEHSIARQFAQGRPDADDRSQLEAFADRIREKLSGGNAAEPEIPGNRPYRKRGGGGMVPMPNENCTKCGLCAEKCPVQAIDRHDPQTVDTSACIGCMRCIAVCPASARALNGGMLAAVSGMLAKVCTARRSGELYI